MDFRVGPASAGRLVPEVKGIIEKNMIDRLKSEGNHGEALVSHALGYLAASRYGLAEDELVDLLSRDLQVYAWFFGKSLPLPGGPGRLGDRVPRQPCRRRQQRRWKTPQGTSPQR